VSVDYRLAPETKLSGMIEDLQDAWTWIHTVGSNRFGIDRRRLAVTGRSAGGYLTLMAGSCLRPVPPALVSFFGYGDIDGPWFTRPEPAFQNQPPISEAEALAAVGKAELSEVPPDNKRLQFYAYCRQQGTCAREISGHDPRLEPRLLDRYCPVRNVTKGYPPTLLIHGNADKSVPWAQSEAMAAALARAGVEHQLLTVPGAGHGLTGAKPAEIEQVNQRAVEWVESHVRS
jgi:acetyl esterase/lipase